MTIWGAFLQTNFAATSCKHDTFEAPKAGGPYTDLSPDSPMFRLASKSSIEQGRAGGRFGVDVLGSTASQSLVFQLLNSHQYDQYPWTVLI